METDRFTLPNGLEWKWENGQFFDVQNCSLFILSNDFMFFMSDSSF